MAHALAPCGTNSAYNRHLRRHEPVDEACRQANNAYQRAKYRQRHPRQTDAQVGAGFGKRIGTLQRAAIVKPKPTGQPCVQCGKRPAIGDEFCSRPCAEAAHGFIPRSGPAPRVVPVGQVNPMIDESVSRFHCGQDERLAAGVRTYAVPMKRDRRKGDDVDYIQRNLQRLQDPRGSGRAAQVRSPGPDGGPAGSAEGPAAAALVAAP